MKEKISLAQQADRYTSGRAKICSSSSWVRLLEL
jgi:hypothetical protein